MIRIPQLLADAVDADEQRHRGRRPWLAALPQMIGMLASEWELELGEAFEPGGRCAWIAPARRSEGEELVLKVGWRHPEAEHEPDALRLWDGDGAVRCLDTRTFRDTSALLLERCVPGVALKRSVPEPEQDVVVARLAHRLWEHHVPDDHPFASLQAMCDDWADGFELELSADSRGLDSAITSDGISLMRQLPRSAERGVLLCTDLHAENVLSSRREPWLVIDPKPFIGDPAYEPIQHMLNCASRLAADPVGLAQRMASLLEVDPERVRLWLFARCVYESLHDVTMREVAHQLAP
jgi:streptomycin 6-kinase